MPILSIDLIDGRQRVKHIQYICLIKYRRNPFKSIKFVNISKTICEHGKLLLVLNSQKLCGCWPHTQISHKPKLVVTCELIIYLGMKNMRRIFCVHENNRFILHTHICASRLAAVSIDCSTDTSIAKFSLIGAINHFLDLF